MTYIGKFVFTCFSDNFRCILIIQNPRALLADKNSSMASSSPCLYIMLDSIPDSDEKRLFSDFRVIDI